MINIAIFIVTYHNNNILNRCIKSLELIKIPENVHISITILNNAGIVELDDTNLTIQVINNEARPNFSTGHLSRNWNQCIMNGFQDINNPKNDIIILAQNDVVFKIECLYKILEQIENYEYMAIGRGDELQILTPIGVKTVGLFDERFCNIGYQEADYFLRARLLLKNRASITDAIHNRLFNSLDISNIIDQDVLCGNLRRDIHHIESVKYHSISLNIFYSKWGKMIQPQFWPIDIKIDDNDIPKQYMYYPYFEKFLDNLEQKYFIF